MMKKVLFLTILIISLNYVLLTIIFDKSIYLEENKNIIGKITYIKEKSDKTVIDVKCKKNKYRVTLYKKTSYNYGDIIKISGVFKTPNNNTVPNLFNYRKYLLTNRIKLISNNPKITLVSDNKDIIYMIKNNMIKHIKKYKSSNYIRTFILGDTSLIEENVLEGYKSIGISHLFSMSGMHLTVFLLILNFLLKKFKFKNIVIFLFFIFLLFITNYPESLVRCILFISLKYLNTRFNIKYNNIELLLLSACLLLLYNPYYIYNIGFLFSFIITLFILLSKDLLKNKIYLKKLIIISLISFLASIPILSNSFFKINLLSVFYNIIFVPIISILIFPLGLITFVLPFLDSFYYILTTGMENIINILSNMKLFTLVISKQSIIVIFIYYLFLILAIKKNKKFFFFCLLILIININSRLFIINYKVTFLDVNQGDSSVIILPKGKTILIDTGGEYSANYSISKNKIIPYLNSMGINEVSAAIITHGDYDHMGEAINLVSNFKVEKVMFNCGPYNDLEKELIKVLDKKKIKYYSCIKELNIDNNKLYFLQTKEYDNENDNSNVIYAELGGYKFMFMGDAGITTEKEILDKYNLPDIDVLKVGHHGSKTSSSKEFINEINPKYSVISVGKKNRYGHPNKEVLENLDNSKIYRTDQDGSIMFKIKNNKLKIETCSP